MVTPNGGWAYGLALYNLYKMSLMTTAGYLGDCTCRSLNNHQRGWAQPIWMVVTVMVGQREKS